MKGKLLISMLLACLPWLAMAQSDDDLYFIPKKEKKVEVKDKVGIVPQSVMKKTVTELPAGTKLVVKDVSGKTRDVDEYNRRYTAKDNNFSYSNDTLYVTEKPYGERGEWVNGFEGSESDYEYAMRLVRFRSPRYAIPVSSPLYWDVVYGAYPSWDWNVYDDGLYAYVFPTYTNRLWWDWRWSSSFYGPGWGFSFGWSSPWYSSWYSPYYCGGYYGSYWGPGWHHHHYPYYGGYYGGYYNGYYDGYYSGHHAPRYNYNNRRADAGRYRGGNSSYRHYENSSYRGSDRTTELSTRDRNRRTGGRVVSGRSDSRSSYRGVNSDRSRNGVYTRPTQSTDRSNRVYTRPSSTRSNSYNSDRHSTRSRRDNSYKFSTGSSSSSRGFSSGSSYRSGGGSSRHGSGTGGHSGGGARRR